MIQPLRRAHRWIMSGLALVLPAIFVAGLAVRQPSPPAAEVLPAGCFSAGHPVEELRSFEKVLAPDLLVYWARTAPSGATLPPDARLLGPLHGTQSLNVSQVSGGYLLAYSLADRRVAAHVPLAQK
jgi:hypothetical protein